MHKKETEDWWLDIILKYTIYILILSQISLLHIELNGF